MSFSFLFNSQKTFGRQRKRRLFSVSLFVAVTNQESSFYLVCFYFSLLIPVVEGFQSCIHTVYSIKGYSKHTLLWKDSG